VLPPEFFDATEPRPAGAPTANVAQQRRLLRLPRTLHDGRSDRAQIRRTVVEESLALLEADVAWISEWNEHAGTFDPTYFHGRLGIDATPPVQSPDGYGAEAIRRMRTLVVGRCDSVSTTPRGRFLRAQRIGSAVCAPLSIGGTPFGVICVGRDEGRPFDLTESLLMGALAAQGAIAIRNASLIATIDDESERLRRVAEIDQKLLASMFVGRGVAGLAEVLSEALDRPVRIVDSGPAAAAADNSVRVPIVVDGERRGTVEMAGSAEPDDLERLVIARAINALAVELSSREETLEAEWRLQGSLLEELASAPSPLPDSLVRRAEHLGVEVGDLGRIIAVTRERTTEGAASLLLAVRRAVAAHALGPTERILAYESGDVVLASLPRDTTPSAVDRILESVSVEGRVAIGVGESGDVATAAKEAKACLNLARLNAEGGVFSAEDLGVLRGVLGDGPHDHAVEFVREVLAPLVAADDDGRIPLLETLTAFIAADGHRKRAAELCFVHLSTMRYRLNRLREVFPIEDQRRLLEARTALAVLRMLRASGSDPFPG
jgi:sugar diacid utilization regulator